MTFQQLVFAGFAIMAILSAGCVVISKNAVRAVLFLVLTFVSMAGLWMLLEMEFLAIVLVLVYVGAVMVLFLFVVMMLDIEVPKVKVSFVRYWPLALLMAGALLALMLLNLGHEPFGNWVVQDPSPLPADYSNVKALGQLLYTEYLLAFEVAGVILLVSMIAAIGLTYRGPRSVKTQKIFNQVSVRKEERLTMVSMPSEKGEEV